MKTEDEFIPFHASDLTGRRVLVLAPHPDDETLGCGGTIATHAAAGDPVKVVFLTNGSQGDIKSQFDCSVYVQMRNQEATAACVLLGISDTEFWNYEDRSLSGAQGILVQILDLLNTYKPDMVYVPSPLEFHPDHRAACFLVYSAVQSGCHEFDIAFYEINQPLFVNALVDISSVVDKKKNAILAYQSQLSQRPYDKFILGLNRFRCLTLPECVTHAEGFSIWSSTIILRMGIYGLPLINPQRLSPDAHESGPLVSIIVRTQDRPHLLINALRSIVQQTYSNIEIIVVNDGGMSVRDIVEFTARSIPFIYINHETVQGRSAAANSGIKAARGGFLNFLDDDDVFYPYHVETLVSHILKNNTQIVYSGVLNVYYDSNSSDPDHRVKEEVVFNKEYSPELLLFENYIPLMSVLFSKGILSTVDGFSEELTLFEDWDFWIRVSRRYTFCHVDKVTAEYRIYGSTDFEASHRKRYHYDESRAKLFDRNHSFITGRAWVIYLNEGPVEQLKYSLKDCRQHIANVEDMLKDRQQHIATIDEMLEDRQQHIVNVEKRLKDSQQHIANVEDMLKDRQQHIATIDEMLEDRQQHIVNVEKRLKDSQQHIANVEDELRDRQQHIANVEDELRDRQQHIANVEDELRDRQQHIANVEGRLKDSQQHIANVEDELKDSLQHIVNVEHILMDRQQHIANLEELLGDRQQHIANLEALLKDYQ